MLLPPVFRPGYFQYIMLSGPGVHNGLICLQ